LDEVKYFQLIFVRRISAPTLEDIVHFYAEDIEHLYEDYDVQCDDRYVMNHCRHCGARRPDCPAAPGRPHLRNGAHGAGSG
jgi:hypothetical protein